MKVVQNCDSYEYIAPKGTLGEVVQESHNRLLVRWDGFCNLYGIDPEKVIFLDKDL